MMTPQQIQYELRYWEQVAKDNSYDTRSRLCDIYKALVFLWRTPAARNVLEVGAGPFNGCLPFISDYRHYNCYN